jgi:hypothetical protein
MVYLEDRFQSRLFVFLLAGLNLLTLSAAAQSVYSEAYTFTTFAGMAMSGSADGAGSDAQFNYPQGVAMDKAGNVYVTDSENFTIRKITVAGEVSTIAGFAGSSGSADGTNSAARFNDPTGIAVDTNGNLYVSDHNNSTIRKITPVGTNWVVSTIAGQAGNNGSIDGTGPNALFDGPSGEAVDNAGNVYVADRVNNTIRKIRPVGTHWVVSTIAGLAGTSGSADGTNSAARFNEPTFVGLDNAGNVYVADRGNNTIRKITPVGADWVVSTIAGLAGTSGSADGTNSAALFNEPLGVAVDSATNVYVTDYGNYVVRRITPVGANWVVSTIAGTAGKYFYLDGTGTNALFTAPVGIAVDSATNLYVANYDPSTIRLINSAGVVSTIAGSGADSQGYANGTGSDARFYTPYGVAVDSAGNVYVADGINCAIRKISTLAVVSTIAGGRYGTNDGVGSDAQFSDPEGVAVDSAGNVYVADTYNDTIRKITPTWEVSTIAGQAGDSGTNDGTGANALFYWPCALAVDSAGNVYVADTYNNTIRKITPVGTNWLVSTIAGSSWNNGSNDGPGANALFNEPSSVAVDSATNLYVGDYGNDTIRKIRPVGTNWVVSTIAGLAGSSGSADGTGTNALFYGPWGLAVDSATNLYVADDDNFTIRKITPVGGNWVVSTIAGVVGVAGSADGAGSAAMFDFPAGVAVDSAGNVYVADTGNNTIRKGAFTPYTPANAMPFIQPANNAALVVTLLPPEANGQWRFPWELAWRNSGEAATNLVQGEYPVEFRTVPDYLILPLVALANGGASVTNLVAVTTGGTTFITNQYYPTITTVDTNNGGSLTVNIGPSPPSGAGWRFLGDTTPFYPPGYSTNLAAGTYLIEFAPVGGFITPASLSVQVVAGSPTVLTITYLLASAPPAGVLLPEPIRSANIRDLAGYPYGFNGQLHTDVGYGSGVAVETNVVLTAAHLVFNDQTLSYVSQAYWFFHEEAGVFVPEPLQARGWYVLSGYASQRTNDVLGGLGPDQSSPQSRNFDVAALYFESPVADGGYGGYLPSDATPNSWLTSAAEKMLVGYPVDGSQFGLTNIVNGQMYKIGPQPYPLSQATDPVADQQVYTASWMLSYPGNSGGPFYVQFGGYYYPAGVYLGTLFNGVVPDASAVRAIDSNVVSLVTMAAALGDSGTNNSGGGVITIIPTGVSSSHPAYLVMTLGPPAALADGAAWEFTDQPSKDYLSASQSVQELSSSAVMGLQFLPVAGWNLPANRTLTLVAGVNSYTANYTVAVAWATPAPIPYGTALSSQQLNATTITSGSYTYSPPAGTVLSLGTHTLSVTFTPNDPTDYGGPSTTNASLVVISATSPVILTARQSGGSFTFTWSATANQTYQIQSTSNLAQANWSNLGGLITATNSTMSTSLPATNSQRFYRLALLP